MIALQKKGPTLPPQVSWSTETKVPTETFQAQVIPAQVPPGVRSDRNSGLMEVDTQINQGVCFSACWDRLQTVSF